MGEMYWLVVPRKEYKYVYGIIRKYYGEWINVIEEGETIPDTGYVIELKPGFNEMKLLKPTHVVAYSGSRSIKTLPPRELLRLVEKARAKIRLSASFTKCHRLDENGTKLYGLEPHPGYDIYFMIGEEARSTLITLGVENPPQNPLLVRRFGGVNDLYSGTLIRSRMIIPDSYGEIQVENYNVDRIDNNLNDLVTENRDILREHLRICKNVLGSIGTPDIVIVSFSGGKDSIVVLDIAIKYYGKDKVIPIFVDTGLEFPQTIEYVDRVSEYYDIEVVKAYAGIDKAVKELGLPSRNNRWCTGLKTRAFMDKVEEVSKGYDKVLIVVGDRDAESASRSHRSPIRYKGKFIEVSLIKQWSTAHVQLYSIINNLPENKLYSLGFYRTGCYICPSLRSLELHIMKDTLWHELKKYPYINEFLEKKKHEH